MKEYNRTSARVRYSAPNGITAHSLGNAATRIVSCNASTTGSDARGCDRKSSVARRSCRARGIYYMINMCSDGYGSGAQVHEVPDPE